MKNCRWCGSAFDGVRDSQVFCCEGCRDMHEKHGMGKADYFASVGIISENADGSYRKTCRWCGSGFDTSPGIPNQAFCSVKCQKASNRMKLILGKEVSRSEWLRSCGVVEILPGGVFRKVCCLCGREFDTTNPIRTRCPGSCIATSGGRKTRSLTVQIEKQHDVTKTCAWCGLEFVTSMITKKFCSRSCAVQWNSHRTSKAEYDANRSITKVCKWCGEEFVCTRKDRIFCCQKHTQMWAKHHMSRSDYMARIHAVSENPDGTYHKICPWCGNEFDTVNEAKQMYCSESCQKAMSRVSSGGRTASTEAEWFKAMRIESRNEDGSYTKTCKWCGNRFVTKNPLKMFCRSIHSDYLYKAMAFLRDPDKVREEKRRRWARHRERYCELRRRKYQEKNGIVLAEIRERERIVSEQEEARIHETRVRYAHVEEVLILPPEERWQYAKDWTDDEKAYARFVIDGNMDEGTDAVEIGEFEI